VGPAFALRLPSVGLLLLRSNRGYLQEQSKTPGGTPIEVVSWYEMMGIGLVVTLRVPAERLREVNRAIEQTAWGGYRTEFYPSYDYKAIGEELHAKAQSQ
jgi:hypothetical protein